MTNQPAPTWTGFSPRLAAALARATAALDDYTTAQFNPPLTHRLLKEAR